MSDAITRKEALLKSIANGTSSALKPITREEQYLAYIAGESKSFPTTPITREEQYLAYIAGESAQKPNNPITREEYFLSKISSNSASSQIYDGTIIITEGK